MPDVLVPILVAHSILSAHLKFQGNDVYDEWLEDSFRKVTLRVNAKEFKKIIAIGEVHLGHEKKTLGGKPSCAVVIPMLDENRPNVLKFGKMWTTNIQET